MLVREVLLDRRTLCLALIDRPGRILRLECLLELQMLVTGGLLGADLGLHPDACPRRFSRDLLAQVREVSGHFRHGL